MYSPGNLSNQDFARQQDNENRKIANAINNPVFEYIELVTLNKAPDKPKVGRIYRCDGTNWDPLSLSHGSYHIWYDGSVYRGLHETSDGTNLI